MFQHFEGDDEDDDENNGSKLLKSGTTSTSLLAALAAGGEHASASVQIALVHLMFNIIGIALFYPIPAMRWPIPLAQVRLKLFSLTNN